MNELLEKVKKRLGEPAQQETKREPKLDLKRFRDERRALMEIVVGMVSSKQKEDKVFGKKHDEHGNGLEESVKNWPVFNQKSMCNDTIRQTAFYAGQWAQNNYSIDMDFVKQIESVIHDSSYKDIKQKRHFDSNEKEHVITRSLNIALAHDHDSTIVDYVIGGDEKLSQLFNHFKDEKYDGQTSRVTLKTLKEMDSSVDDKLQASNMPYEKFFDNKADVSLSAPTSSRRRAPK